MRIYGKGLREAMKAGVLRGGRWNVKSGPGRISKEKKEGNYIPKT